MAFCMFLRRSKFIWLFVCPRSVTKWKTICSSYLWQSWLAQKTEEKADDLTRTGDGAAAVRLYKQLRRCIRGQHCRWTLVGRDASVVRQQAVRWSWTTFTPVSVHCLHQHTHIQYTDFHRHIHTNYTDCKTPQSMQLTTHYWNRCYMT